MKGERREMVNISLIFLMKTNKLTFINKKYKDFHAIIQHNNNTMWILKDAFNQKKITGFTFPKKISQIPGYKVP